MQESQATGRDPQQQQVIFQAPPIEHHQQQQQQHPHAHQTQYTYQMPRQTTYVISNDLNAQRSPAQEQLHQQLQGRQTQTLPPGFYCSSPVVQQQKKPEYQQQQQPQQQHMNLQQSPPDHMQHPPPPTHQIHQQQQQHNQQPPPAICIQTQRCMPPQQQHQDNERNHMPQHHQPPQQPQQIYMRTTQQKSPDATNQQAAGQTVQVLRVAGQPGAIILPASSQRVNNSMQPSRFSRILYVIPPGDDGHPGQNIIQRQQPANIQPRELHQSISNTPQQQQQPQQQPGRLVPFHQISVPSRQQPQTQAPPPQHSNAPSMNFQQHTPQESVIWQGELDAPVQQQVSSPDEETDPLAIHPPTQPVLHETAPMPISNLPAVGPRYKTFARPIQATGASRQIMPAPRKALIRAGRMQAPYRFANTARSNVGSSGMHAPRLAGNLHPASRGGALVQQMTRPRPPLPPNMAEQQNQRAHPAQGGPKVGLGYANNAVKNSASMHSSATARSAFQPVASATPTTKDDEPKPSSNAISIAEYKKRNNALQSGVSSGSSMPIILRSNVKPASEEKRESEQEEKAIVPTGNNNYEIHTARVIKRRAERGLFGRNDMNNARMLVMLGSGEQRLITFTLPPTSCTVHDLLEQVSVPYQNTTIRCTESYGPNVDFVVSVGDHGTEFTDCEILARAESALSGICSAAAAEANEDSVPEAPAPAVTAPAERTNEIRGTNNPSQHNPSSSSAFQPVQRISHGTHLIRRPLPIAHNPIERAIATPLGEVNAKFMEGFNAVCSHCGFTSPNHAQCPRCRQTFREPPKLVPVKHDEPTMARPSASATRGRGVGPRGGANPRPRAPRRQPEPDPIVMLSSDDEDDAKPHSDQGNSLTSGDFDRPSYRGLYQPFSFEPSSTKFNEEELYREFLRTDVTDLSGCIDSYNIKIQCKSIRLGRFYYEPKDEVIFTSKGVQIKAPNYKNPEEYHELNIHCMEIVRMNVHLGAEEYTRAAMCIYLLRNCQSYIEDTLGVDDDNNSSRETSGSIRENPFHPNGMAHLRRIVFEFASSPSEEDYNTLKRTYRHIFDEISSEVSANFFKRNAQYDVRMGSAADKTANMRYLAADEDVTLFSYPPKNGIPVTLFDFLCLAKEQYLNDAIIDFYLNWVRDNIATDEQRDRAYIFSSFFYKRLTTNKRGTDPKMTAAQKRHERVQKWTKNVNLFKKDFIVIPINEASHWFLAIICYPYLTGPVHYVDNTPIETEPRTPKPKKKKVSLQIGNTTITPMSKTGQSAAAAAAPLNIPGLSCSEDEERDEADASSSETASETSEVSSSDKASNGKPVKGIIPKNIPVKQPVILIFDSLPGTSRSRVSATLRDYLTCEYQMKMPNEPPRTFNKDSMPGHCVKVPKQDNFTDCGLFLLHYVEKFFQDPIVNYRLPINQLKTWFEIIEVTKKREDIALLIQDLTNQKNTHPQYVLPAIELPTCNGELLVCEEPTEGEPEFEEETEEEEEEVGETDNATEAEEEEEEEELVGDELDTDALEETPIEGGSQTELGVSSTTTATSFVAKRSGDSTENSSRHSSSSSGSSQPTATTYKRRSDGTLAHASASAIAVCSNSNSNGTSTSYVHRPIAMTLANNSRPRSSGPQKQIAKIRRIEQQNSNNRTL